MDPLMNVERSDDGVGPADGEGGGERKNPSLPVWKGQADARADTTTHHSVAF